MQAQVTKTTYLGKRLSDHNPLELTMRWGRASVPVPTWRLQPMILEDTALREELAQTITTFFHNNAGSASSPLVEWEAFKVVIRGVTMGATSGVRKTLITELTQVGDRLGILEKESISHPTKAQKLHELRTEHAQLVERLQKFDYAKYKERTHKEGDKAGPLLARLIRGDLAPTPILHINTPHQGDIITQLDINTAFKDYSQHYTPPHQQ
ncbi:hypothetical protein NDU88_001990 [Pleurodeles waltl]|uniref:Uncharacterized protein n=1 Tax=Pleurodeles waltl TaxID=8319 RepID=A0AAV7WN70_PLEWA|nr:hypothetical protein NDU88_001990 [Pleurodeles waltl]